MYKRQLLPKELFDTESEVQNKLRGGEKWAHKTDMDFSIF